MSLQVWLPLNGNTNNLADKNVRELAFGCHCQPCRFY